MSDKPKLAYLDTGPWPLYVGFTASQAEFDAEMKRLKIDEPPHWVNGDNGACCHWFEQPTDPNAVAIITINIPKGVTREQIAAMLAHEAVHVAQFLWEDVGEVNPGKEAEAYLVQSIVQFCLYQLKDGTRKRKAPKAA